MENATVNYITRGTGHMALLAAIVEQARHDAGKVDKTTGKPTADALDALQGIKEWANIAFEDVNFKMYE